MTGAALEMIKFVSSSVARAWAMPPGQPVVRCRSIWEKGNGAWVDSHRLMQQLLRMFAVVSSPAVDPHPRDSQRCVVILPTDLCCNTSTTNARFWSVWFNINLVTYLGRGSFLGVAIGLRLLLRACWLYLALRKYIIGQVIASKFVNGRTIVSRWELTFWRELQQGHLSLDCICRKE